MSEKLKLLLQGSDLINEMNHDMLIRYLPDILTVFGGIKECVKKLFMSNVNNDVIAALKSIHYKERFNSNNNNTNSNQQNNDKQTCLELLPKHTILYISNFLEINEVGCLNVTCIKLGLATLNEINKVDIKVIYMNELLLNSKDILAVTDWEQFYKNIRCNGNITIRELNKVLKYNKDFRFGLFRSDVPKPLPMYSALPKAQEMIQNLSVKSRKYIIIDEKPNSLIRMNSNKRIINLKYFDIKRQELYFIDIINCIDSLDEMIQTNDLITHIKNVLFVRYESVFKDITIYRDNIDVNRKFFKFVYQKNLNEKDMEYINMNQIFIASKKECLIFYINATNNDTINFNGLKQKINEWKQNITKQGKPFCIDPINFTKYRRQMRKIFTQFNHE